MIKSMLVFVGAGVGGVARYWIGVVIHAGYGGSFPFGTLIVNISGCLAVGFLSHLFYGPMLVRDETRTAILVGVLGGYTTFSSFGRETMTLITDGEWARAALYVALSVFVGLAAVWLGSAIGIKLYGAGAP